MWQLRGELDAAEEKMREAADEARQAGVALGAAQDAVSKLDPALTQDFARGATERAVAELRRELATVAANAHQRVVQAESVVQQLHQKILIAEAAMQDSAAEAREAKVRLAAAQEAASKLE